MFVPRINPKREIQLKISQATFIPTARLLVALLSGLALLNVPPLMGADSKGASPSIPSASLSADQVVDSLVRNNQERAQALLHSEGTRIYHLAYRGFPSDRDAEMTVKAIYDSPSSKEFKVVSSSGSKLILNRVFKKLMESETEAAQPAVAAQTQLNRDNYNFELVGYETSSTGGQYVLHVTPKSHSKYVYVGKVWVDAVDFAVTHIEVEPTQNPSFWTKKSEIRHEYKKVGAFWLPVRNESVSYIRLGGRATLTIEYTDYHLTAAGQPPIAHQ
jgi:membrane peptidoglycan carboxypeptidase